MHTLQTDGGNIVTVIDESCEISKYYEIVDTLSKGLKVCFFTQDDCAETIDWDFQYKHHVLTLHYHIFNGTSIYPQHKKDLQGENNSITEIVSFLRDRGY